MAHLLIIGCGYVGLVTGACFAEQGHNVVCFDVDPEKIGLLQKGTVPIYEPNLEKLIQRHLQSGFLSFSSDAAKSFANAEVCFLTVNTPLTPQGGADLSFLEQALRLLAEHLQHPLIIAIKSTVPVGTASWAAELIAKHLKAEIPFDIVSNPEFLREGNAINDFLHMKRVVIGTKNPQVVPILRELYRPFMQNNDHWLVMDPTSAELSKYIANAMLATRISFMNEVAGLCERLGANIDDIHAVIGSDPRIGNEYLQAGVGYGGSCLHKDMESIQFQARAIPYSLSIMKAVDEVNQRQKERMAQKIKDYFASRGGLKGKVIAILGLAFKPNTDDMREAPALTLIHALLKEGVLLRLFDPVAIPKARLLINHPLIHWAKDESDTVEGADAIVFMTEWKQFNSLDFDAIAKKMKGKACFDGRNQFSPEKLKDFDYIGFGR